MQLNKRLKKLIPYILIAALAVANIICIYRINGLREYEKRADSAAQTAADSFRAAMEIVSAIDSGVYTADISQAYDSVLIFESAMQQSGYTSIFHESTDISERMNDTKRHTNQLDSELRVIKNICRSLYRNMSDAAETSAADASVLDIYRYYRVYDFCRYYIDYISVNNVDNQDSFEAMLRDMDEWCMENIPEE